MNLAETLNITAPQKSELTDHLIAFLQYLDKHNALPSSPNQLINWWLKFVKKPAWIARRADSDLNFIAQVNLFFEKYKDELHMYGEAKSKLEFIRSRSTAVDDVIAFYNGLAAIKGLPSKQFTSPSEVFRELDVIFSPKNDGYTMSDFEEHFVGK
jgi:hypothetical protein